MSVQIGDLIYNFITHKVGWVVKHPANQSALWTIEYSDGRMERYSEAAIKMFINTRNNALKRSKKNI
jgi:hypothetical protein